MGCYEDGWNTIVPFWGPALFQVQTVSFKESIKQKYQKTYHATSKIGYEKTKTFPQI